MRLLIGPAFVVLLTACNPTPPDQQALEAYASAVAFYQDGRFDPAAALLTEITTDHPDFHQARMLQGRILFLRAQYDRAAEVLAELERSYPSYPEASLWLNRTLIAQGEIEQALTRVESLLEFNPEDPRLLRQRAQIADLAGRPDQALALLTRATATEELQGLIRLDRGRLYARFGLSDAAVTDVERALHYFDDASPLAQAARDLYATLSASDRGER